MNKLLLSLMLVFALSSCKKSGPTTTQTLSLATFSKVSTQGGIEANIYYGQTQSVQMTGGDHFLEHMDVYVHNDVLILKMEAGFFPGMNLVADIYIPTIEYAEIKGAGAIWIDDFANLSDLKMNIEGAGHINTGNLDLSNGSLNAEIHGSGIIEVQGMTNTKNIKIAGSGEFYAHNMAANYSYVDIDGSGHAEVNVSTDLHVEIAGSGKVLYKGQPNIETDISGSGDVEDAN